MNEENQSENNENRTQVRTINPAAKKNWTKVRQLLISSLKTNMKIQPKPSLINNLQPHHQNISNKEQQEPIQDLPNNTKNNLYNLFTKSTKIVTDQIKQQQRLIQTQYMIELEQKIREDELKKQQQDWMMRLVTRTPLPSIQKILNATQYSQKLQQKQTQIDTTGFWIWEAEQILAYFLIKNYQRYLKVNNKAESSLAISNTQQQYLIDFKNINRVLQLGAGSSGLAAITLTKLLHRLRTKINENDLTLQKGNDKIKHKHDSLKQQLQTIEVKITDGKHQNIQYLLNNIRINLSSQMNEQFRQNQQNYHQLDNISIQSNVLEQILPKPQQQLNKYNSGQQSSSLNQTIIKAHAECMLWGTHISTTYDLILAADCLFFQAFHNQLIKTLQLSMHLHSTAIFVNPNRGKSMQNFIEKAKNTKIFEVKLINFNDKVFLKQQQKVKQKQNHDQDRHLFNFIILRKIKQNIG